MNLDELRDSIVIEQKKGLPFIMTSVVIWSLITIVSLLDIPVMTRNLLVFCCAAPLLPLSFLIGKILKVDIFSKDNPLSRLGLLFTLNQLLYLLIVMWVYCAAPEKMVMVYAMVFGAHLFPYSWLYRSKAYMVFAVAIPILSLILGMMFSGLAVAAALTAIEVIFAWILFQELKHFKQ